MKYSISNWIYGDEPLETTFQRLQSYGYDGVQLKGKSKLYQEWAWSHAILSVREATRYAEARGILLAVEPINRYETFLVTTVDDGLRFIEEVNFPAVKIHLDVFHMNIQESNIAEAIRRCGKLIINLHISVNNRMAVGDGHVNFRDIMYALKEIHYQEALTMEPIPPVPDPYIATRLKRYEAL